jgi:RNA recognition motif-containing protein
MSSTVFLGNLPAWVTADDIKSWLTTENLVADSVKVIRNPETQESKGFAFIEAPNDEEMHSIIRRFDRAPLEDRLLRANPAQPPKPRGAGALKPGAHPPAAPGGAHAEKAQGTPTSTHRSDDRHRRGGRNRSRDHRGAAHTPQSAFAEELAKAL